MNKNTFLWALYDFANTPLTAAIGGLYLAQWIILDNHIDDIWYGGVFTLSTILLLIVSPFLGAWSDKLGKRMPFIKWATIVLLVFGIILGIIAPSSLPAIQRVILALILFFILQLAYQISLIFYGALLDKISTPKNIGKISGIGEAFGEAGWLLGPAMLLPFAIGTITLFGEPGRAQVFLPAVLALAVLGLPMIFWFKEPKTEVARETINFKVIYDKTIDGFKTLIKNNKNVTIFLISFMFVSDAILTARALLIKISPAQQLGEYFGFFATFQRFASIIGPLTWGGITLLLKDYGIIRYQIAVLALAFLMIIGILFLVRVKEYPYQSHGKERI